MPEKTIEQIAFASMMKLLYDGTFHVPEQEACPDFGGKVESTVTEFLHQLMLQASNAELQRRRDAAQAFQEEIAGLKRQRTVAARALNLALTVIARSIMEDVYETKEPVSMARLILDIRLLARKEKFEASRVIKSDQIANAWLAIVVASEVVGRE